MRTNSAEETRALGEKLAEELRAGDVILLEGSLGAVNGFASKVGAGVGAGILGILIGLAGYDGNLAVQPASAITMIRLLYSLIPAAMNFVVYLVFRLYSLDKQIPQIRAENEARRAEAEAKHEA